MGYLFTTFTLPILWCIPCASITCLRKMIYEVPKLHFTMFNFTFTTYKQFNTFFKCLRCSSHPLLWTLMSSMNIFMGQKLLFEDLIHGYGKMLLVMTTWLKFIERTIQTKIQGFKRKMYVKVLYKREKTQDKL